MGKTKRLRLKKKKRQKGFAEPFSDRLSENFQRELKNSELWDPMVAEFGEEKALELLTDCKADITPLDSES
jgi:hypothetical protein